MIAVHLERGRVSVRSRARPRLPRGHALLRLAAGGICNTDLELQRGYYGFRGTPGHEFVAVVEESPAHPEWTGKRVVGEINLGCGRCHWCEHGWQRHCPRRTVLGIVKHPGAFQELFTLPVTNLIAVPPTVSTEHAVFTEPIAAACEILDQVLIPKGADVGVLGDGKLGLLIAQVLAAHGAHVHLFGRHRRKLAIAEASGVHTHAGGRRPRAAFHYVVDATGSAEGFREAAGMTVPRGVLILKSTVHGAVPVDTAPVIVNEITIVGSRCGRFAPALQLLKQRKLNLDPMLSAQYPLREAPRAFARAAERGVLKVLLRNS
jgi:alcohol dehydrogenase